MQQNQNGFELNNETGRASRMQKLLKGNRTKKRKGLIMPIGNGQAGRQRDSFGISLTIAGTMQQKSE
jgi:hypothetical protein